MPRPTPPRGTFSPAGQASFNGCLAVVSVARDRLLAVLPSPLQLLGGRSATYPCLLVFGEQHNGTAFLGGLPVPWASCYLELMVAVPLAGWHGAPHLFVVGMTCDAWWAAWSGNVYYGFQKQLAPIVWDGRRFLVTEDGADSQFDATTAPHGAPDGRALSWIRDTAALPVLGRRSDGSFVRSQFDWDFEHATIEGASLDLARGPTFRGLPLIGRRKGRGEAFVVEGMKWRLGWPGAVL